MIYSMSYDKLMQYALRILSKKRYTNFEMQKKLALYANTRKKTNEEDVSLVLERLKELNYIDDEKFIKDYISTRIRLKPRGKALLKRELKFKGISKELLDKVFENIEFDEDNLAIEQLARRSSKWSNFDQNIQKIKAYRFLYSHGFNREAIYKALRSIYNTEREES